MPLEFWLALGSVNNGSYGENQEFAAACKIASGKEAKREAARAYVKKHKEDLASPARLVSKARNNFASGFFGLPDFQRYPMNTAYEFFNDYGTYGRYVAMLATGYFYAILFFGILLHFFVLMKILRGGMPGRILLVTQLTILGLMIFLMIWESNNRQLYNHMPWFALMGTFGFAELSERRNG